MLKSKIIALFTFFLLLLGTGATTGGQPVDDGFVIVGSGNVYNKKYVSKTGSALDLLMALERSENLTMLPDQADRFVANIEEARKIRVSIRFSSELDISDIEALEVQGLTFTRIDGEVMHSGTIYGVDVPIDVIDTLAKRRDVLRIESVWQPGMHDTLDISVPEINANDLWQFLDGGGNNVTGDGLTVADFDTGIDVFHPDFWSADGPSYDWLDTNSNGTFDPGVDAVDLDGDSSADADEILDFFDAGGSAGILDGVFQVDMDWLYNDSNDNGQRDFGAVAGFTEADPTYGELIFIADDTNDNNSLDVGESLVALGTSKVVRTLNIGGVERIRGTDLIQTDNDTNGHGTSVCGIINGGTIGPRIHVGVAPNAELLVADRRENDFTVFIPWARSNGADVMLYEFGGWTQQFLDGSSNLETAIDNEAAAGIVQVVPAGNLGGSDKHAQDDVARNNGSTNFTFNVPSTDDPGTAPDEDIEWVYITVLWRTTGNDLDFTITTPTPSVGNLPASPGDTNWHSISTADGHTIWYRRENSTRGTAKYDISINQNDVVIGGWTLQATNSDPNNDEHADVYISDDRTSWSGGAVWTAFQTEDNTITRPATADSAITVASYSTRGWSGVAAGDISNFNPTGPRIDGQAIMDIAAPGNFDIASAQSKDSRNGSLGAYRWFSGTSASGPHVAGASALLLQLDPSLDHGQIKTMLQQNARTDGFTGVTPNNEWGHGKLDVLAGVNESPVCDANGPYTAECQGAATEVSLNGTGSSDPNTGDILDFAWTSDCPGGSFDDSTNPSPTLDLQPGCYGCGVSLTVTDLGGESDSCSSPVQVVDTLPPDITCPPDATIECDESTDPANTGTAVAADICDTSPVIEFFDETTPGECPEESTITRTWTSTDTCGNVSFCTQVIDVVDTTAPVLTISDDIIIECHEPTDPSNTGFASASDNCDSAPTITYSDVEEAGDCPAEKTITRTWTATDNCGNSSSADQIIEVVDTTPPVISSVSADPDTLWPPNHKMQTVTVEAVASDNCDPEPTCKIVSVASNEPINGNGDSNTFPDWEILEGLNVNLRAERSGGGSGRIYTITVECEDDCGNSSSEDTTVVVPHDMGKTNDKKKRQR
jgi:subtilisin family serine protease